MLILLFDVLNKFLNNNGKFVTIWFEYGLFKTVRLVIIGSLSHSFDSPVSIIAQLIRTIGSSFDSQSVPFFDDGDDSDVGTYCLTTVVIWIHKNCEYLDVSIRKVSRPQIISFFYNDAQCPFPFLDFETYIYYLKYIKPRFLETLYLKT